ncbi:ABC-type nitrate/sulfonate/bicarbonate transport system substrate-binding protein [Nitrobacteraceae bacterium AZCC 1564]
MSRFTVKAASGLVAMILSGAALAADPEPINLSYQVTIHGVQLQIAEDNGWWQKMNIKPGNMTSFVAGAQQVAASASGSWDIGLLGGAPALLGASRFKLHSGLVLIDDKRALAFTIQGGLAEAVSRDPVAALKGKSYVTPVNSFGDFAAKVCQTKLGLKSGDMTAINVAPGAIVDAFRSQGDVAAAGIWAPHWLRLEKEAGGKTICTVKDGGKTAYSTMVVRPEYLKDHMDAVARFTAMYLRATHVMKTDKAATLKAMKTFYDKGGVKMSPEEMEAEYSLRDYFDFDEQMAMFDRSKGQSTVDKGMSDIGEFMAASGSLSKVPNVNDYVDPSVLQYIASHAELKAFAKGE